MSFERKTDAFNRKYLKSDGNLLYNTMKEAPDAVSGVPDNTGIYHTSVPTLGLKFKVAPGEREISHAGCYITLGYDRPGVLASGMGARGYSGTSTIDLVVGRGANANGGKGPQEGAVVNNMFSSDAARIYISQKTNIDRNFGIAEGVPLKERPGAGIGMKADDIRIIAKNSLKIMTGRADGVEGHGSRGETNSFGGKSTIAPTIQLIAGNYTSEKFVYGGLKNPIETVPYLQAAIKGDNMVKALRELNEIIGNIWSAVFNLALVNAGYTAINSIDPLRPWVAAAGSVANSLNTTFGLQNLWATRVKGTMWEQYYLDDNGYRCIKSPNVYLT